MADGNKRVGGALFKNAKKTSQNAPDYTGSMTLDADLIVYIMDKFNAGEEMVDLDLAGWKKKSGKGIDFLSLSVKPKRQMEARNGNGQGRQQRYQDDSPF